MGTLPLAQLPRKELTTVATRGATSDYFDETLFGAPLNTSFAEEFFAETYMDSLVVERTQLSPWYESPWGWGFASVAVGTLAGGAFFHLEGLEAQNRAQNAQFTQDRLQANSDVRDSQLAW